MSGGHSQRDAIQSILTDFNHFALKTAATFSFNQDKMKLFHTDK